MQRFLSRAIKSLAISLATPGTTPAGMAHRRVSMIRSALLASAILLGTGAAQAQDAGPRLVGGGENAVAASRVPSRNIVGGGFARLAGGDNQSLAYSGTQSQAPSGLIAEVVGGGENRQLIYREAPAL